MKTFILILCGLALLAVSCVNQPESINEPKILPTEINEEDVESQAAAEAGLAGESLWVTVAFDELPFATEIPEGWSLEETPPEYTLWFDLGLSGSLVFQKKGREETLEELVPEGAEVISLQAAEGEEAAGIHVFCSLIPQTDDKQCTVQIDGNSSLYTFVLKDKGMGELRRAEAEEIMRRIGAD